VGVDPSPGLKQSDVLRVVEMRRWIKEEFSRDHRMTHGERGDEPSPTNLGRRRRNRLSLPDSASYALGRSQRLAFASQSSRQPPSRHVARRMDCGSSWAILWIATVAVVDVGRAQVTARCTGDRQGQGSQLYSNFTRAMLSHNCAMRFGRVARVLLSPISRIAISL
jgi:hypothetical protein